MDKIINKFNNLSLPAVILMASLIIGGFYYAGGVNKQKSIEKQQQIEIEQKRQEQLDKGLKEQEAKTEAEQVLNTCLANANESYSNNWFRVCKSQGRLTRRCISLHDMTLEEYEKEKNTPDDKKLTAEDIKRRQDYARDVLGWSEDEIQRGTSVEMAKTDFYKEKDECFCGLPLDNADRINKVLQDDKDECFRKYPLN